jgi:hypothetical protein
VTLIAPLAIPAAHSALAAVPPTLMVMRSVSMSVLTWFASVLCSRLAHRARTAYVAEPGGSPPDRPIGNSARMYSTPQGARAIRLPTLMMMLLTHSSVHVIVIVPVAQPRSCAFKIRPCSISVRQRPPTRFMAAAIAHSTSSPSAPAAGTPATPERRERSRL